jgi:hypothetical protein
MQSAKIRAIAAAVAVLLATASSSLAEEPRLKIAGTTYTKFLWGNMRNDGSLYSFTTVPGDGYGDNGQGSEVELFILAKVSKAVEVKARLHSRFNQNQWTNFGGWGGPNPPTVPCIGGDCGEFDSRSNQYVKLRGVAVTITPGYKWIDAATIGANDFGMFDPWVIGKIRYIDRDNASGLLFQGSGWNRRFAYDVVRISLPRLWAGPNYTTGEFTAADAAYGVQFKQAISPVFDLREIFQYVNDIEVKATDYDLDDGREVEQRFRNSVVGVAFGFHPGSTVDVRGSYYYSNTDSDPLYAPANFFGLSGFSPVPAGSLDDDAYYLNVDLNNIAGSGLTLKLQGFRIGAQYVSMMAARREADVLVTEGHDSAYMYPGPSNASFGVFAGNPTRIGIGGWDGNAQQVPTINVDNEFTDFDEPMAETVIGWKGITVSPVWTRGALELAGEYTHLGYDTNWQAFGDDSLPVTATIYPVNELDTGVGHNFRSAYAPFQDKKTDIALVKAKYTVDVGNGLELWGKFKRISETDDRLNDARFLPYQAGDCPGGGVACANAERFYSSGNSTSSIYGNPGVISVGDQTGYQWKPFDSISDDDRDLSYWMTAAGLGYQLTHELYAALEWSHFDADLEDGNTAFQAYNLHEMASGQHKKDILAARFKYNIGGAEFGFELQYNTANYQPDFGSGFLAQVADEKIAKDHNVAVGSLGFSGRYGGWNSLEERDFSQYRMKGFMKVQF